MREIKFRTYDTETNEMSYDFLAKNWLRVGIESPYVNLMQYTGLKDKNGVEIYEGDILKTPTNSIGDFIIDPITWEEGCFLIGGDLLFGLSGYLSEMSVVIGNIYQNPELLEDQQ